MSVSPAYSQGYRVDKSITEAISKFLTPVNRTVRAFFGLANQLSASTATVAELLAPLRPLLSTKNEFVWPLDLDQAFTMAKQSLTSAPTLSFFDQSRPTRLCTDASRQGLGFVLQQKSGDNWTLIQAGSRFLSDAESRYAVIELELLAVSWAIIKCRMFLAGLPHFTVLTDHHSLIPILNNHRLDEIENPRLQRLKTKIMAYNFTTEWVKGVLHNAPDALSRSPISDPLPHEMLAERDFNDNPAPTIAEIRVISSEQQESVRLQDLRKLAGQDHEYQQLHHYVLNGFPEHRNQLPDECKRYWHIRSQLALDDDLIVYGCRLVIPSKMRLVVLSQLHESHQGCVRTKQRARLVVYWPGVDNDIENTILACQQCLEHLPSHPKEPITIKPRPSRPFQELAADFCSYAAQDFLILVDCYSDWPDIIHMGHNTTTPRLTAALTAAFCRSGAPDIIWSDQGPQFTSKTFQDFSKAWGFQHVTSSPMYPQSNGKIEATVKSMKKLIRASWTGTRLIEDRLARALLQYRNTPSRRDGLSPAQKLFGRPIRFQPIAGPSHQSGKGVRRMLIGAPSLMVSKLSSTTTSTPGPFQSSMSAPMSSSRMPPPNGGTSTGLSRVLAPTVVTMSGLQVAECWHGTAVSCVVVSPRRHMHLNTTPPPALPSSRGIPPFFRGAPLVPAIDPTGS